MLCSNLFNIIPKLKYCNYEPACRVYILASKRNGTFYTGVTTDLKKRVWQHKNKATGGFTARYDVDSLVHFEIYDDYWMAANRERCVKEWKRAWKLELIEKHNPQWRDLYDDI